MMKPDDSLEVGMLPYSILKSTLGTGYTFSKNAGKYLITKE